MECIADTEMQPQLIENITKVIWLNVAVAQQQLALEKTYASIRYILAVYYDSMVA